MLLQLRVVPPALKIQLDAINRSCTVYTKDTNAIDNDETNKIKLDKLAAPGFV